MIIPGTISLDLEVEELQETLELEIEDPGEELELEVEEQIVIRQAADPYEGAYEVMPSFAEQALPTAGKQMLADVTVHAIPVSRTSNLSGGITVFIGGN